MQQVSSEQKAVCSVVKEAVPGKETLESGGLGYKNKDRVPVCAQVSPDATNVV